MLTDHVPSIAILLLSARIEGAAQLCALELPSSRLDWSLIHSRNSLHTGPSRPMPSD